MGTYMVRNVRPCTNVFLPANSLGWGDTGIQETSTDKLQETLVPIIQTSKCLEKMNQTEGPHVDESRIVCTGDAGSGGPCQVTHKPNFFFSSQYSYPRVTVVGHLQ